MHICDTNVIHYFNLSVIIKIVIQIIHEIQLVK